MNIEAGTIPEIARAINIINSPFKGSDFKKIRVYDEAVRNNRGWSLSGSYLNGIIYLWDGVVSIDSLKKSKNSEVAKIGNGKSVKIKGKGRVGGEGEISNATAKITFGSNVDREERTKIKEILKKVIPFEHKKSKK